MAEVDRCLSFLIARLRSLPSHIPFGSNVFSPGFFSIFFSSFFLHRLPGIHKSCIRQITATRWRRDKTWRPQGEKDVVKGSEAQRGKHWGGREAERLRPPGHRVTHVQSSLKKKIRLKKTKVLLHSNFRFPLFFPPRPFLIMSSVRSPDQHRAKRGRRLHAREQCLSGCCFCCCCCCLEIGEDKKKRAETQQEQHNTASKWGEWRDRMHAWHDKRSLRIIYWWLPIRKSPHFSIHCQICHVLSCRRFCEFSLDLVSLCSFDSLKTVCWSSLRRRLGPWRRICTQTRAHRRHEYQPHLDFL